MKTRDFDYDLPEALIALEPLPERSASRLMCLDPDDGKIIHRIFSDIVDLLEPGDMLVFNNSKVVPARLYGKKETGGKVEILVERVLDDGHTALAHVKSGKAPVAGTSIILSEDYRCTVQGREDDLFILALDEGHHWRPVMDAVGEMPLPPYIDRQVKSEDSQRYQTVYAHADKAASVAAPTAGLHFDDPLLARLKDKGIHTGFVTLHVGAGTFQPLRTGDDEDPRGHVMHSEIIEVSPDLCEQVMHIRRNGGRIIAVGSTSIRCLESAWNFNSQQLEPYVGETDIFIAPGYEFGCVDAVITNFHFPRTSLLMLVSAFAGHAHTMNAYHVACEEKYRFFSYGDAMYIATGVHKNDAR